MNNCANNHLPATNLVATTTYGIDPARRLDSITHKRADDTVIDSFTYGYDKANRVISETTPTWSKEFKYDFTNQFLGDGTNSYAYDKTGNRTMVGYQTNPGNRLFTDGTWTYSYDFEGNLKRKERTGEVWDYTYNEGNQLTRVEKRTSAGGAVTWQVDYTYDALGNRGFEIIDVDGAGLCTPAITQFAYDNFGNAWADLIPVGSGGIALTRRLYLDATDALFAKIEPSGNAYFYLTDRLGSVRDIIDSAALVEAHRDYDAFGKILASTGNHPDRYGWTARERDADTGLQYNRGRYYSFDVGRWINQDPLKFGAGDTNLYRYAFNNSTNLTDPSGQLVPLVLGLGVLAFELYGVYAANRAVSQYEQVSAILSQPIAQTTPEDMARAQGLAESAQWNAATANVAMVTAASYAMAVGMPLGVTALGAISPTMATVAGVGSLTVGAAGLGMVGYQGYNACANWNQMNWPQRFEAFGSIGGTFAGGFAGARAGFRFVPPSLSLCYSLNLGMAGYSTSASPGQVAAIVRGNQAGICAASQRPMLPAFDGQTTRGILMTNDGQAIPLQSGAANPTYANYPAAGHVEGQAAIWIRDNGSSGGVVYHNNPNGTCGLCHSNVPTLLPEGATLSVRPPAGTVLRGSRWYANANPYLGNSAIPKPIPTRGR